MQAIRATEEARITIFAQVDQPTAAMIELQVEPLLEQIETEVQVLYDDGAYDQWKVYETLVEQEVGSIIPPRKTPKSSNTGTLAKSLLNGTRASGKFVVTDAKRGRSRSVITKEVSVRPLCTGG